MSGAPELDELLAKGARLYGAGQSAAAAGIYRKALAMAPEDPTVRLRHALAIWHGENRAEEALAEIQALEAAYPQAAVHSATGLILNSLGRFGEGAAAARRAVTADPGYSSAWLDLATATGAGDAAALEAELYAQLQRRGLADRQRRQLHFAVAVALRKQGRDSEAFDAAGRGNALSPRRWDSKREAAHQDLLRAVFTPGLMDRLGGRALADERMIFIVGMPRSGTTLLERMLAAHPDVGSVGETPNVGNLFGQLQRQAGSGAEALRRRLAPEVLGAIGQALLKGAENRMSGARPARIIDKMPANYLFVPLIALVLPKARILHVRRHPLDTCLSCWEASFSFGLDYASDLGTLGTAYRQYADMMRDWKRLLGDHVQEVVYERLVEDPVRALRPILAQCGLGWDPRCLIPDTAGPIKTASVAQARAPISTGSIGRWRRFGDRLGPLIDALGGMDWVETHWAETLAGSAQT